MVRPGRTRGVYKIVIRTSLLGIEAEHCKFLVDLSLKMFVKYCCFFNFDNKLHGIAVNHFDRIGTVLTRLTLLQGDDTNFTRYISHRWGSLQ